MKGIASIIANSRHQAFERVKCPKGNRLFSIDDTVDGVYLIQKGKIKLLQKFKQRTQAIWIADEMELIGITSFFGKEGKFQFTAEATEDSELIFVPGAEFQKLLESKPKLNQEIIQTLCLRISFVEQLISKYVVSNTKLRLQEILKFYVNRQKGEGNVTLPFSIADFADMAGTSPEYIGKLLKTLQNKGLLMLKGNSVRIDDTARFIHSLGNA